MANNDYRDNPLLTLSFIKLRKFEPNKIFVSACISLLFFGLLLLLRPTITYSAPCEQWVAKAVSVEGQVESRLVGETS